jgi:hypothetical protein
VVTQTGALAKGEESPTLGSAIARRKLETVCTLNTGKFHLGGRNQKYDYQKLFETLFHFYLVSSLTVNVQE